MSREAGLAAVRQRRWGEASELLGELAASGQADAAALDKQKARWLREHGQELHDYRPSAARRAAPLRPQRSAPRLRAGSRPRPRCSSQETARAGKPG